MLKIGDFSRLANTSVRILRYYDEINLLKPKAVDSNTGYRYYEVNQLDVINRISYYKDLGISLSVIKEILQSKDNVQIIRQHISNRINELKEESQIIKRKLTQLESAKNNLGKEEITMQYSVVLKKIPEREVISLRKIISSRDEVGLLWVELNKELEKQKIPLSKDCISMAIYYDDEYKETDIDVEIQTAINRGGTGNGNIKFYAASELDVVSVTFRGDYDQRPQVSIAIADWLETSDFEIDGPMISIFHVTPYETDNPENWITEVCYAVKKIK